MENSAFRAPAVKLYNVVVLEQVALPINSGGIIYSMMRWQKE